MAQLSRNMIAGAACSLLSALLMAVSYPLYLRYLGYERYGLWLVLTTVLGVAQLSNLGLGQAVAKQVAEHSAVGDDGTLDSCVSTALCALLTSGGLVWGVVIVFRGLIASLFHLSLANTALVSALLPSAGFLSLYAIYLDTLSSVLTGMGRIDLFNYVQTISQVAIVSLSLLLLHQGLGIQSFIIANAAGFLLAHCMVVVLLRRRLRRPVFRLRHFSWFALRNTLKLSLYLMGGSAVNMLVNPLNKFLLARFVGVGVLPTYDIVVNGSMKMRSLIEAGLRAMMPEVSRLTARGDHAAIIQLNRRVSGSLLLFGGLVYSVILVVCGMAVNVWLGSLAAGFPFTPLRVVLLGTFLSLLGVPAYYTLLGLGNSAAIFVSNLLQSGAPFVTGIAMVALTSRLTLGNVLYAVAAGMALSTAYLVWERSRALKERARTGSVPSTVESCLAS